MITAKLLLVSLSLSILLIVASTHLSRLFRFHLCMRGGGATNNVRCMSKDSTL